VAANPPRSRQQFKARYRRGGGDSRMLPLRISGPWIGLLIISIIGRDKMRFAFARAASRRVRSSVFKIPRRGVDFAVVHTVVRFKG